MDVFAVGTCALCAVVFGALIKKNNREYSLLITAGAAVVLLLAVLERLEPLAVQIESLGESAAFQGEYLAVMLKAAGIAVAGQFSVNLCKDAGESALAGTVELAAKTAILAAALPLLTKFFGFLEEILTL